MERKKATAEGCSGGMSQASSCCLALFLMSLLLALTLAEAYFLQSEDLLGSVAAVLIWLFFLQNWERLEQESRVI